MITEEEFNSSVQSKLIYLTNYYRNKHKSSGAETYAWLSNLETIKMLRDKETRLFLEPVDLVIESIKIEEEQGIDLALEFLYNNIG